ncbi:RNA-binding transcriptional accessory protein [Savagea sp. SN6]|uniref:RNA-binding transcriptional accessory protein n=1 Tax=Savagea serpentis TaxID=2785297 RepID=A0A8J7G8L7_9BACL|nr:Tex family protein [Savagea serpentis]MBF4501183.1 RNA-binding transcriptional accessory protein [Savagea serpentis]
MELYIERTAQRAQLPVKQTKAVIALLDEGNTVPFIARYRKEATGSLDEVQIKTIEDSYTYVKSLMTRQEEVVRLIQEQDKLTPELERAIQSAMTLQQVEDLYRPYKQKRRTRATQAIELGLQPLADALLKGESFEEILQELQQRAEQSLEREEALQGARDILAEQLMDDLRSRNTARKHTKKEGKIVSQLKKNAEDERAVYANYYEYAEPLHTIVPHRTLALNRGEKEDVLKVSIQFPESAIEAELIRLYTKNLPNAHRMEVEEAVRDGLKRLLLPSVERELRADLTEVAEAQAIRVFGENLKSLLLQPPLKGRTVLSIDPAFRTGCKLAVIDEYGKVLAIDVIYPHPPKPKVEDSLKILKQLIERYDARTIAIGNGTASRETEQFVANALRDGIFEASYVIVNEAGASVYSASEEARHEFPKLQVEQRSAISIARRLQDPLSELVKIEPSSIGVGQYQHDVSKKELEASLAFVVEMAVNTVGVNVNTASSSLLRHVAGLSKTVADNIVNYREENGPYKKRTDLKKVPRLGAKTYEQAIGFLRIYDGPELFDATGIHPESYKETEALLKKLNITKEQLGEAATVSLLDEIDVTRMKEDLAIGEETLKDIIQILKRPNRDPREDFPQPILKSDVLAIADLHEGMELQGTVRNVVDFGAFVDIGVTEDGLVHISKLANRFVKHPLDVVASGDIVTVWVESVDKKKGRIGLTMVQPKQK